MSAPGEKPEGSQPRGFFSHLAETNNLLEAVRLIFLFSIPVLVGFVLSGAFYPFKEDTLKNAVLVWLIASVVLIGLAVAARYARHALTRQALKRLRVGHDHDMSSREFITAIKDDPEILAIGVRYAFTLFAGISALAMLGSLALVATIAVGYLQADRIATQTQVMRDTKAGQTAVARIALDDAFRKAKRGYSNTRSDQKAFEERLAKSWSAVIAKFDDTECLSSGRFESTDYCTPGDDRPLADSIHFLYAMLDMSGTSDSEYPGEGIDKLNEAVVDIGLNCELTNTRTRLIQDGLNSIRQVQQSFFNSLTNGNALYLADQDPTFQEIALHVEKMFPRLTVQDGSVKLQPGSNHYLLLNKEALKIRARSAKELRLSFRSLHETMLEAEGFSFLRFDTRDFDRLYEDEPIDVSSQQRHQDPSYPPGFEEPTVPAEIMETAVDISGAIGLQFYFTDRQLETLRERVNACVEDALDSCNTLGEQRNSLLAAFGEPPVNYDCQAQ